MDKIILPWSWNSNLDSTFTPLEEDRVKKENKTNVLTVLQWQSFQFIKHKVGGLTERTDAGKASQTGKQTTIYLHDAEILNLSI